VTDDADAFARKYDRVVANSSLQCVQDWRDIATRLATSAQQWIFITRLPIVGKSATVAAVQRPFAAGYQSWVLNRDEFLGRMASLGATLEREFLVGEITQYAGAEEVSESVGFLFRAPS
jgi:hypothetical protein